MSDAISLNQELTLASVPSATPANPATRDANAIVDRLETLEDYLSKFETALDDQFAQLKAGIDNAQNTIQQLGEQAEPELVRKALDNALDQTLGEADYVAGNTLSLDLQITTDFGDNGIPAIASDFSLAWNIDDSINIPTATFKNVQLDLSSFFQDFAEPVIGKVDQVLEPFEPIRKILTQDIPGFDKIGIHLSIAQLAKDLGNYDSALFDAIDQIATIVDAVDQAGNIAQGLGSDRFINLGDFSVNANGQITTTTPYSVAPLQQVADKGLSFFSDAQTIVGGGFAFPLLETPDTAFKLLLGQPNVELLEFQLPGFSASFDHTQTYPFVIPTPIPIPAFIQWGGNVTFTSPGLTFGYDTAGLTSNAPLQGFYVDGSQSLFSANAGLNGRAGVGIPGVLAAGGGVFLTGQADFYLSSQTSKVRLSELDDLLSRGSFNSQGKVQVGADLWAEHITLNPIKGFFGIITGNFKKLVDHYRLPLITIDLFNFGDNSPTLLPPNLANVDSATGALLLNIGTRADQRNVNKDEVNEQFVISSDGVVAAFGYQETHAGYSKIVAQADAGNDAISVEASVIAELHGGIGDDTLDGGSLGDQLFGDEGSDRLSGRGGDDQLFGGEGNDTVYAEEGVDQLQGDGGNDFLDGGADNDLLSGNDGADTLDGNLGDDVLFGGDQNDRLFGSEGQDTLYGDEPGSLIGGEDLLAGGDGNDTLNGGIGNDQLFGETGEDTLLGNAGNDQLDGGEGDDILQGGEGDDQLVGGFRILSEPVFNAEGYQVFDANGNPVFTTPEILDDAGNDSLDGGQGNDLLQGNAGNDFLIGTEGNDTIDGGSDIDTVNYASSPVGVTVNIDEAIGYENSAGYFYETIFVSTSITTNPEPSFAIASNTAYDGYGTTDTLQDLENIIGSEFDDFLIGSSVNNTIEALGGNDVLVGGAGDDQLDGGAGVDTISYRRDRSRVSVNLEQNIAADGFGNTDTLSSIENVVGSAFDDQIMGDAIANTIYAGDGSDRIEAHDGNDIVFGEDDSDTVLGEAGDDYLVGGIGADLLNGGDGTDTASYFTADSGVTASLTINRGVTGEASGDVFQSIENLEGSEFNDRLIGDRQSNTLSGIDSDDFLDGRAGNDTLHGGTGRDSLLGATGNDILYGDAGKDALNGGEDDDLLDGGEGNDDLWGDVGNDTLYGQVGQDALTGDEGNDFLYGGTGQDTLEGQAGSDQLFGGDDADFILGGNDTDTLYGDMGDDNLDGGNDSDVMSGGIGDDYLYGAVGNDYLSGDEGQDYLEGGLGSDRLAGGISDDALTGGSQQDLFTMRIGDGTDQITDFGGIGKGSDPTREITNEVDTLKFEGKGLTAENILLTQVGSDLLISFEGVNTTQAILLSFALDTLDNLPNPGGQFDQFGNIIFDGQTTVTDSFDIFDADQALDQIWHQNTTTFLNDLDNVTQGFDRSNDVINAQSGNDHLNGMSGDDLLRGGDGDDVLVGGLGQDILIGGNGSDIFVLKLGEGADTINQFESQDLLRLDMSLTLDQLAIAQGVGNSASDTLISDINTSELLATLTGVQATTLTGANFV